MESWYVCAVEPRAEEGVVKRAAEIKATVYYPQGKQMVRRGRVKVVEFGALRPAMPGYVFVEGSRHFANFRRDFDAPDAVAHCLGWLSGANGPEPVAPEVVEDIKNREADGEFDALERTGRRWSPRWLKARAKVRIVAGPFKGVVAEVWRVTRAQKVAIWMNVMGRPTLTELAIDDVARVR